MTDVLAPPVPTAPADAPPVTALSAARPYGVGGPAWGWGPPPTRKRGRLSARLVGFFGRATWLAPLSVLVCAVTAFGYVLANDPTDSVPDMTGPCVFRELTGLDCPGCGGTRMVWYLMHGDLVHAARYHLFALAMIPLVVYAYAAWAAKTVFAIRLPTWRPTGRFWAFFALSLVAFMVLRNLPIEPFLYFRV